jgi:NIMA (never in mitosis gene a)-related kinase
MATTLGRNNDFSIVYGTLANFIVEKKIGKGQFSEVYRAQCRTDGNIVALKKVQVMINW